MMCVLVCECGRRMRGVCVCVWCKGGCGVLVFKKGFSLPLPWLSPPHPSPPPGLCGPGAERTEAITLMEAHCAHIKQ